MTTQTNKPNTITYQFNQEALDARIAPAIQAYMRHTDGIGYLPGARVTFTASNTASAMHLYADKRIAGYQVDPAETFFQPHIYSESPNSFWTEIYLLKPQAQIDADVTTIKDRITAEYKQSLKALHEQFVEREVERELARQDAEAQAIIDAELAAKEVERGQRLAQIRSEVVGIFKFEDKPVTKAKAKA